MIRLYRVLLHFYPKSFRLEYDDELTATFARECARTGALGKLAALIRAIADIIVNATAVHFTILRQDLHYTARTLSKARGFAFTAVLVTALGVGANTAALSVADFVLMRPLPFAKPERLMRLCEGPVNGGGWGCNNQLSPSNYRDFKSGTTSFEAMGAFARTSSNLVGRGEPQRVEVAQLTSEVLPILGIAPVLGRWFDTTAGESDARTVILGYGLWQSQFGRNPNVLGQTVTLNGAAHEVIGVMPSDFYFPSREAQLWTPLVLSPEDLADRGNSYIEAVTRLKDGITEERATADLLGVAAQLRKDYPDANFDMGISFFRIRDEMSPRFRVLLLALGGASLCMLLLTCANLANLLLVRTAGRERELAVRLALGAGRERLIRQMITESVTLALIGGAAGVVVGWLAVPLLGLLVPTTLPIANRPAIDLRALTIAALCTGLTGIGFGLIPAFRAGRQTGFETLREGARSGGGRKQRLRGVLVTVEVAMSVALLITSGLLIRAIWRVQSIDPGFRPQSVLTLRTALPRPKYDHPDRRAQFYQRVLPDVRRLPGVEAAAYISGLPMVMTGGIGGIAIPGREVPRTASTASRRFVTPQYFRAMRIPLLRGRDIEDRDSGDAAYVAVVSESFGTRYWPGEDPIGKVFEHRGKLRTIVGVVGEVRVRGLERTNEPQVYLPAGQVAEADLSAYDPKELVIRFSGEAPSRLVDAVRAIVRAADPDQPVSDVRMLEDIVAGETAPRLALLRVLAALAAIALLISGVGIHGLLAYTVSQRSHEIGVRLALGAERTAVARMVLAEGMTLALLGIVAGVAIAYASARGMSALLFGVEPGDPVTFGTAVALALIMALAGALLPALRAVRLSPMQIMR